MKVAGCRCRELQLFRSMVRDGSVNGTVQSFDGEDEEGAGDASAVLVGDQRVCRAFRGKSSPKMMLAMVLGLGGGSILTEMEMGR